MRRRVATRKPRRTFLVFCEGERTEIDYLKALRQEPDVRDVASVDIRIDRASAGGVPMTLVKEAADALARISGEDGEIDEVWWVFDVEWPRNHPNLREALDLAKARAIRTAVSNPCFELWLALHFKKYGKWLDNDAADKLRRDYDSAVDKGVDGAKYMPRRADAARRARCLRDKHERDGTAFPNDNPSSGMYKFLEAIEGAA
ncbi:RloB family protein [Candidatus Poriferisodalis sp.]|uniref:RloB family protein n=1 Tax=Candidatus Poriferisodalis sp. TaxID=3101277 RepID=UPI003C700F7D